MLYVKSEDGKVLEIKQADFKSMKEVLEHSSKIFAITEETCLVTEPIHGCVGVLVTSYKTLGKSLSFKVIVHL